MKRNIQCHQFKVYKNKKVNKNNKKRINVMKQYIKNQNVSNVFRQHFRYYIREFLVKKSTKKATTHFQYNVEQTFINVLIEEKKREQILNTRLKLNRYFRIFGYQDEQEALLHAHVSIVFPNQIVSNRTKYFISHQKYIKTLFQSDFTHRFLKGKSWFIFE